MQLQIRVHVVAVPRHPIAFGFVATGPKNTANELTPSRDVEKSFPIFDQTEIVRIDKEKSLFSRLARVFIVEKSFQRRDAMTDHSAVPQHETQQEVTDGVGSDEDEIRDESGNSHVFENIEWLKERIEKRKPKTTNMT